MSVRQAVDGGGALATRHLDPRLTELREHEQGLESQRVLVLGVGGAEVALPELEVAEERGHGRAVEGDAVGRGVGFAHRAARADRVAVELTDVGQARVCGQARVAVEELLERRRRVVVVPELHLGVDRHRQRVGIVGIARVDAGAEVERACEIVARERQEPAPEVGVVEIGCDRVGAIEGALRQVVEGRVGHLRGLADVRDTKCLERAHVGGRVLHPFLERGHRGARRRGRRHHLRRGVGARARGCEEDHASDGRAHDHGADEPDDEGAGEASTGIARVDGGAESDDSAPRRVGTGAFRGPRRGRTVRGRVGRGHELDALAEFELCGSVE